MLIPVLNGLVSFWRAPATWMLVALNTFVLVVSFFPGFMAQTKIDEIISSDYFLASQGRIFSQYVAMHPSEYGPLLHQISQGDFSRNPDHLKFLGNLALKDKKFLAQAPQMSFSGDQVAIEFWKKDLNRITQLKASHPSFLLGLSADDTGVFRWVSYIFAHSGGWHFLGNMIFLVIFGCFLEPLLGSLTLMLIFVGSGMIGAGTFLILSGASMAPLIGASGAVSGLMAVFAVLFFNRPVRYGYWLFVPARGFAGFIFLPGGFTLFFWLLSDLAGYWGSLPEMGGGVAYGAHLGGELAGVIVGLTFYCLRRKQWRSLTAKSFGTGVSSYSNWRFPGHQSSSSERAGLFY